jgi:hypothetical protein
MRNPGGHDRIGAEQSHRWISKMHRAALAFGTTSRLAQHFRHGSPHIQPFCDRLAVTAIGAGHVIIDSQCPTASHGSRLLSHAWVKGAADSPLLIQAANRFFKLANDQHLSIGILQSFCS